MSSSYIHRPLHLAVPCRECIELEVHMASDLFAHYLSWIQVGVLQLYACSVYSAAYESDDSLSKDWQTAGNIVFDPVEILNLVQETFDIYTQFPSTFIQITQLFNLPGKVNLAGAFLYSFQLLASQNNIERL